MKKLIAFVIILFWPLNILLNGQMYNFSINTFTKTVFTQDYQAEQRVLDKINLYPTVLYARVFQNKGRIYLEKISNNFFAVTDINNYFFGFHPSEIIGNQNLKKFPFISVIFFLVGLYFHKTLKYKKRIFFFLTAAILYLTILENFDRADFLLWLPLSLITVHGLDVLYKNKRYWKLAQFSFWIFTTPQIIRMFLGHQ